MKRNYHPLHLTLLFALTIALSPSCMKENTDISDTSGMVTIGYTIDGIQAGTYSIPAEGHELAVNDIHILFYELAENSGGGKFRWLHYLPARDSNARDQHLFLPNPRCAGR